MPPGVRRRPRPSGRLEPEARRGVAFAIATFRPSTPCADRFASSAPCSRPGSSPSPRRPPRRRPTPRPSPTPTSARTTDGGAVDCFLDAVEHLYTMCRQVKSIEIIEFGYEKSDEGVNGAKSEYCVDKHKQSMTRPYQAALREATGSRARRRRAARAARPLAEGARRAQVEARRDRRRVQGPRRASPTRSSPSSAAMLVRRPQHVRRRQRARPRPATAAATAGRAEEPELSRAAPTAGGDTRHAAAPDPRDSPRSSARAARSPARSRVSASGRSSSRWPRRWPRAIAERAALIAEAGTGTGKTFAYLVPALLYGGKVIVSTGTKTLQDQLFQRDLPLVRDALSCRRRSRCSRAAPTTSATTTSSAPRPRAACRRATTRGTCRRSSRSRARPKPATAARSPTSRRTRRSGRSSRRRATTASAATARYHADCFVLKARKAALEADVVVVNHHLFFADVMLRDEGLAELLPACNTVVLDEAHQLPDTATLFFGEQLTAGQLAELARDAEVAARTGAREVAELPDAASGVGPAIRKLRLALGETPGKLAQRDAGAQGGLRRRARRAHRGARPPRHRARAVRRAQRGHRATARSARPTRSRGSRAGAPALVDAAPDGEASRHAAGSAGST